MSDAFPERRVALRHGHAGYREAGAGFPIVIVPGLGLSSRFYERSYATFESAGLRLIVPDLPGTGATPGPHTGITPDMVTEFLIEFIDALHIDRALYVGHSLGTQSVIELAMVAPARVAGIALTGPTGSARRFRLLRQAQGLVMEGVRVRPGIIGAVAREYLRVSPVRYIGTWVKHRDPVPESRLSEIDCPTLLLLGERDAVIDHAYMALLQNEIPDITTVRIPDGSHALPRSQNDEFDAAIISFARQLRG